MDPDPGSLDPASWLIAAGRSSDPGDPLNVPIVAASNFLHGNERTYARDEGTPTWSALEDVVGKLEGGRSVAFSSGMASVAAVFEQLPGGARVVLPPDCYHGVTELAGFGAERGSWTVTTVELDDTQGWVDAASDADLIWLESPSNPLLTVADLVTICAAPRKPGAILAVDNTFATPLNQQPLRIGADLSMQSATKLIGGHSDLLAGLLTTRDDDLLHSLREARTRNGSTPGALEAYLALRGVRTMALRLERAQATAMELAGRLEGHTSVGTVRYPGLASHPTHETAASQLGGFGTIISFDVADGAAAADRACAVSRLIRHATSLGGVESTMERRAASGSWAHVPESLIRMSVGIEDVEDLWVDLEGALSAAAR